MSILYTTYTHSVQYTVYTVHCHLHLSGSLTAVYNLRPGSKPASRKTIYNLHLHTHIYTKDIWESGGTLRSNCETGENCDFHFYYSLCLNRWTLLSMILLSMKRGLNNDADINSDPIAIKKWGVWHARIGIHNDDEPMWYFKSTAIVHFQYELSDTFS